MCVRMRVCICVELDLFIQIEMFHAHTSPLTLNGTQTVSHQSMNHDDPLPSAAAPPATLPSLFWCPAGGPEACTKVFRTHWEAIRHGATHTRTRRRNFHATSI
jgi:hypothetical protein